MSDKRINLGFLILLLAALFPAFIAGIQQWFPPSYWFELDRVYVHDTVEGKPALMEIDRTIHRPVTMEWTVEVNRETMGGFYAYCVQSGQNDYRPGSSLPAPTELNLDWWTWPRKCDLPAGRYQVETTYRIRFTLFEFIIRNTSNTFTVR